MTDTNSIKFVIAPLTNNPYNPEDEKVLDMAAKLVGTPKRQITSTKSEETPDVDTQSPIKPIK